ncbi:nucleotidyltransferase domain-containing protein [Sulfitobacter sp. 1A13353]|jgi:predicted nucleotidyltransferase|uniref:nucleotidyltransferase domain-containing protein n=1 Tax=Sulfitobacter sp. 1A13353 TaxID=3368568 RepID=UPI0037463527
MTKTSDIIQRRAADRRKKALVALGSIKSELEALGLESTLFGSLAKGGFMNHSDIDLMVRLGDSGMSRSAVERIVNRASPDIPVDLFFEEDLTEADLKTFVGN